MVDGEHNLSDPAAEARGVTFNIQRFCTHDGPGIRTTVFLKGCPLKCLWCHNPEGIAFGRELAIDPAKCIACGHCFKTCPQAAHVSDSKGRRSYRDDQCALCGRCAEGCYAGALELIGKEMTAAEVMAIVVRDEPFYRTSGGGVTVSGGEPMAQPEFTRAILQLSRRLAIPTAVETCLCARWEIIESLLPQVDYWMCDVKHTDPARHRELAGADNGLIIENLHRICASGATVLVRYPLVPGYNDDEQALEGLKALILETRPSEGLEILPFHRLGEAKYRRIRRPYSLGDLPSAIPEQTRRAAAVLSDPRFSLKTA
ncbi:MAG TPA: glycyl-radical enzyme activating protein [Candidatus Brocadiia bacterium]|nr:glycyl-radical enzyme activating protein [Candidatus Brocadiia bacterium]